MTAVQADDNVPRPVGRYEWENVVRRISDRTQFSDELQRAALLLATYADPDGTRVRPGEREFADALRKSKATAQRRVAELQRLGLLCLVARGGGHGPGRRASEFRLTLPLDLLDRLAVRDPGVVARRGIALVTPLTEVEGGNDQNAPQPRVMAVAAAPPVDNSRTPITQDEGSTSHPHTELPSNNGVTKRNSPQIDPLLPSSHGWATPTTTPTTEPTTTNPDPAQPHTGPVDKPEPPTFTAKPAADPPTCDSCTAYLDPDGTCFICRGGRRTKPRGIP